MLDEYLLRYSLLVKRKKNLEARRNEIINEFNSPLSGVDFDRMHKGNRIGDGCAVLPLQVCDIEIRIKENIEEIKKDYQKINDIIDFLPGASREKLILEYRYIDRMGWDEICRTENTAKTPVVFELEEDKLNISTLDSKSKYNDICSGEAFVVYEADQKIDVD